MKDFFCRLLQIVGLSLMAVLCSCSDEPKAGGNDFAVEYTPAKSIALSDKQVSVAKGGSAFADKLFNLTSQMKNDDNFLISPLGASITLSMVANAAAGNTREQILEALNIEENDIDCLNELNRLLIQSLPTASSSTLNIYNSLWYNSDNIQSISSSFTSALSDFYQSPAYGVSSADYLVQGNKWIADKTNGGVQDFIKPNEVKDFILSFFNILDFYSSWQHDGKVPTEAMKFHNANGSVTDLTALIFDDIFAWSTGYGYVFDICYSGADRKKGYALRVILPYEDVSIDDCLSTYKAYLADPNNYHYALSDPESAISLKVYLPEMAIESEVDLIPVLKNMGVTDLFDSKKCELSNAVDVKDACANIFKQYTQIQLDEIGTKYQTVTQSGVSLGATPRPISQVTKIDRPFAFEIYEASTGVSILQGRINNL